LDALHASGALRRLVDRISPPAEGVSAELVMVARAAACR
jgi:hypothetical protein